MASLTQLFSGQACQGSGDRCAEFLAAHSPSSILRREQKKERRSDGGEEDGDVSIRRRESREKKIVRPLSQHPVERDKYEGQSDT